MGAGASRRDAKEATRLRLVRAGLELFIQQGFDGPSLDSICAHAGYTRGAFYVHFKDRDELIAAAMRLALDELIDSVLLDGDGGGDLDQVVMRYVDMALISTPQGYPDLPFLYLILEACRRSPEIQRMFVAGLANSIRRLVEVAESGQRNRRVRADLDAEAVANLLVIMALGARVAIEVGLPFDLHAARDAALRLLTAPERMGASEVETPY